ncbi:BMP family ABC transporter substrate-binding protein [Candidatus Roseilinea sp. NK_OTU-006]|uniref:BMP family ABC transporter substrate-binding protein n=1 Tax=Candidatus Roseilinea sp. NK_OTU-006 TaxID=2704250 RepID=UPI00145CC8CE|nr:BMP family ABC transporter substrate-binding protein [Candidatus Roseilinea sp. NK_OTU-006]
MNKRTSAIFGFTLAASLILAACAPAAPTAPAGPAATQAPASAAPAAGAKKRVKLVLNGTLGDKSFFDSAQRGMEMIKKELGYEVRTIELGYDRNKWEPGLEDAAAADDYDILVAGTFDMSSYISRIAPQHPDKKFWMFDAGPDYEGKEGGCSNKCENVYTVLFRQNEGSYLLGVLVGELIKAGALPGAEGRNKVGIVGGLDIPVINDFIVGFKQGFAESGLNPEEHVLVQYVGGDSPFNNPAKGKEIASAMYDQGAAIVWGVAGNSGNGVFEAAVEKKLYALGVDSDQYQTIADPAQKATIITSMLKNVDQGLLRAAKLDAEGKLVYGAPESIGVAADAVGVADNENYQKFVPQDIQAKVKAAYEKVAKGEVKVDSAFK